MKSLDNANAAFAQRLFQQMRSRRLVVDSPYLRPRVLTVDDDHAKQIYPEYFRLFFGIDTIPAESDSEAKLELTRISDTLDTVDAITTDLTHLEYGGTHLINYIRNLPDETVMGGSIRLRHVPIVVITARYSSATIDEVRRLDPNLRVVPKPCDFSEMGKAIDDAICDFRAAVLKDIQHLGLAVIWDGVRFSILSCYAQTKETLQEGKYFAGPLGQLSEGYARLVLVAERLTVAEQSVAELEHLLNDSRGRERDLQNFFTRHPEFLYRGNYTNHWAEPVLQSETTKLRPDFVLQPRVLADNPWEWEVLDLKRSDTIIATAHSRHPDLSAAVHHGCAQLRNYAAFFADKKNHDRLRTQFGGIVPQPKLALVIGRFLGQEIDTLGKLRRTIPDVQILTYDEILAFRRAEVEHQRRLRNS